MFIKYLQTVGIILVCINTCDWDLNKLILEFNAAEYSGTILSQLRLGI